MKTWMKRTMIAVAIATTGLTIAGASLARGDCEREGPRGERTGWHQMAPEKMKERAESRLDQLGERLALRDDQAQAWAVYRESMLSRVEAGMDRMRTMRSEDRPATALERMERMQTHGQARQEAMGEMRKATEAFYSVLDESQRKAFDEAHAFRGKRHGDGYHRGGHGSERAS